MVKNSLPRALSFLPESLDGGNEQPAASPAKRPGRRGPMAALTPRRPRIRYGRKRIFEGYGEYQFSTLSQVNPSLCGGSATIYKNSIPSTPSGAAFSAF